MSSEAIHAFIQQEFENLRKSSGVVNSLIENTNFGLAVITSDYHVVDLNSKMREWFPDVDTAASPFCYESFFCSYGGICPGCPATKTFASGEKATALMERQMDSGNRMYKILCAPLNGPDGEIWGALSILDDVTEEVHKEEKVKQLEAQYIQIIENASDAIIIFNRQGEILQINRKAQDLSGYQSEEVRGQSISLLMPEDRRSDQESTMREIFSRMHEENISKALEGRLRRKDGGELPIELTFSLQKTINEDTLTAIIRDISERKSYEDSLKNHARALKDEVAARTKQLEHTEERYRVLVETASDAIISADGNGNIVYFNKKAEEVYGYLREEIIGKHIAEIAPPEIWHTIEQEVSSRDGSLQGKVLESYGIKRDQTTFPVEFTISVVELEGAYNITLIARDITLRKSLEHELQEYTAKLEEKVRDRTYELTASQQSLKGKISELSILKEISEGLASAMELEDVLNIILVGATSHHGLGFNRAFMFLVSDDGRYLEGKVAVGPSDGAEAQKIWGEILGKNLTLKEILKTYTNKFGEIDTHVNSIIKTIRIPLEEEDHILIRVIKDRQSMNIHDAFNNSKVPKRLLNIMNSNAFALIPLIAEDNVLGVLWADNAITRNAIEDRDIERLRAFAINASLAIEKSNLYKNIQENVVELNKANKELKDNRDRLIRSEKLAAVGEMSATVAHGIRNPLVSIGGFARRLLKKEDKDSTNKKYLQIIVTEIDRLESILSELLDFVRPKKLKLRQVSFADVIESTLELFTLVFEKKNVVVNKEIQPDLPLLEIDTDQFKRVLHNLFNNAMDAMPNGGTLHISADQEAEWVKVSIADTGLGIEENDVEKVFHPFFTSKSTGSGLGLAVCNQIVSIHGGHIKLRRQLPHGMVFDVYLPLHKGE